MGSSSELNVSEEAELHNKVILPAPLVAITRWEQFQEYKQFSQMMDGASRKRSREDLTDVVSSCRSSSSYDTILIDVEDDVRCPECGTLHRHALNYCSNCGSKMYN